MAACEAGVGRPRTVTVIGSGCKERLRCVLVCAGAYMGAHAQVCETLRAVYVYQCAHLYVVWGSIRMCASVNANGAMSVFV